jgi:hypothetical protein
MGRILAVLFSTSLICVTLPNRLSAQATNTAQLRGTIKDSSNAVIPSAKVAITSDATGISESGVTDGQGRYIFNALKPDRYTVRVAAAGFRITVHSNVELRVGQQTDLDFVLEVGQTSETIDVTAEAPLLNTITATLGTEIP